MNTDKKDLLHDTIIKSITASIFSFLFFLILETIFAINEWFIQSYIINFSNILFGIFGVLFLSGLGTLLIFPLIFLSIFIIKKYF